jgi:hypothetical protein
MSYGVKIEGAISAAPSAGTTIPSGTFDFPFSVPENYALVNPIPLKVSNAVDLVVALGLPNGAKRLYFRVTAAMVFKISYAAVVDQAIPCNGLMILGDGTNPITTLKVTGTGEGEILACGD